MIYCNGKKVKTVKASTPTCGWRKDTNGNDIYVDKPLKFTSDIEGSMDWQITDGEVYEVDGDELDKKGDKKKVKMLTASISCSGEINNKNEFLVTIKPDHYDEGSVTIHCNTLEKSEFCILRFVPKEEEEV